MELIASDISLSPDPDTLINSQKQSSPTSPTKRGGRKLTSEQVEKLVYWIATFVKRPEIVKNMKEEFNVTIHPMTVEYYKHHDLYKKIINKHRERWSNDLLDVELANKRRRLMELERIYQKCMSKGEMKNALSSLYQIQHEVDKDIQNLSLTNYNVNIYKDMTDSELEEERLKCLERVKQLKGVLPCPVEVKEVKNENPASDF